MLPSNPVLCAEEKSHVRKVLKMNGYNDNFIDRACEIRDKSTDPQIEEQTEKNETVVLPNVQGISERIKRSLSRHTLFFFFIRTSYFWAEAERS